MPVNYHQKGGADAMFTLFKLLQFIKIVTWPLHPWTI